MSKKFHRIYVVNTVYYEQIIYYTRTILNLIMTKYVIFNYLVTRLTHNLVRKQHIIFIYCFTLIFKY